MKTRPPIFLLLLLMFPSVLRAEPFNECPIEAFLVQDRYAQAYGVNLGTGYYQLLSDDMGTDNKLNAVGFNYHDAYLYAWGYEFNTPVRIGNDYQVESLSVDGMPGTSFYVGDVSVEENAYYTYKPGADYGLYRIGLDGEQPYRMERIIDGAQLNLRIYDFAFHPDNGGLYAVDANGELWRIDPTTGASSSLGNTGVSGTFGAAYFDVTGLMYVSRNSDGYIYRIDPGAATVSAELFALGPASSNNDGARCALAPVVSQDASTIDFGDAPESFGTYLADNGARHDQTQNTLFLGAQVDTEADAWAHPLSDDSNDAADDDGVVFITALETGSRGLVSMTASESGYVNAWIDFDQSGSFEDSEQILAAHPVVAGRNSAALYVPLTAVAGTAWSRFRLTSAPVVDPIGGAPDGEVEDYPLEIIQANVVMTHYPSANGWSTIAYEDTWPVVGDYDMNDVVVRQRTTQYRNADDGSLVGVRIKGEIVAIGASFHNGFGVRLPGVARSAVIESGVSFVNNYSASASPLEAGREEAIVIIAEDLWEHIDPGESCEFYRTSANCGGPAQMTYDVFLPIDSIQAELSPSFDPFLFATPGFYRDVANLGSPGRSLEIHLKNQEPTEAFDRSLLGREDDASIDDRFFQNSDGMPWALEISQAWDHPLSGVDLIEAYPAFVPYVQSQGASDADWFTTEKSVQANVFKE